jgi:hypothetical protein
MDLSENNFLLLTAVLAILFGFFTVRCSFMNYPNKYCHWLHRYRGTMEIIAGILLIYTVISGREFF